MTIRIQQISNDNQISFAGEQLVKSYPPNLDEDLDFQQLVLKLPNNAIFEQNKDYLITVKLPQNRYYDMNFGVRLMNLDSSNSGADLRDITNYQFIKFITVPKIEKSDLIPETVWLYQINYGSRANTINAALAIEFSIDSNQIIDMESFVDAIKRDERYNDVKNRANKFFYYSGKEVEYACYFDYNGQEIREAAGGRNAIVNYFQQNGDTKYATIEPNLMLNNFNIAKSEKQKMEISFVIHPESNYNAIFLCLKLIETDNDIQWIDPENNNVMHGRYVDMDTKPTWSYVQLNNILENIPGRKIKTVGVWGRSEQIMAINGQEIKIGPSGYFELDVSGITGLDINSLAIANTDKNDKYTVDIQYELTT